MPYKYGHYYVGFVLAVILTGFWASYFRIIGGVPFAFHVHAFSATSWLLLLILQSLSIHQRHNAFHKLAGLASFVLRSRARFALAGSGFFVLVNVRILPGVLPEPIPRAISG